MNQLQGIVRSLNYPSPGASSASFLPQWLQSETRAGVAGQLQIDSFQLTHTRPMPYPFTLTKQVSMPLDFPLGPVSQLSYFLSQAHDLLQKEFCEYP